MRENDAFVNVYQPHAYMHPYKSYGVATIGRLLKITGLFCKRAL